MSMMLDGNGLMVSREDRWEEAMEKMNDGGATQAILDVGTVQSSAHSKAYCTATQQASFACASSPCCRRLCGVSKKESHAGQECMQREAEEGEVMPMEAASTIIIKLSPESTLEP